MKTQRMAEICRRLNELNTAPSTAAVLMLLRDNPQGMTLWRIGGLIGTGHSGAKQVLRRAEQKGFVKRTGERGMHNSALYEILPDGVGLLIELDKL